MADTDHTGARRALNGWATHPLLELLSKISAPLATAIIAAGVFALFHMGAELTELRTLYGALDEQVEQLRRQVERIEDRQYEQRPLQP